jgi:PIN domain
LHAEELSEQRISVSSYHNIQCVYIGRISRMHIYIDANIFVTFFEISQDALAELEKLAVLLRSEKATLWLPKQTRREFWQNREKGIKKLIEEFSNHNLLGKAPLLVREDANYKTLKDALGVLEKEGTEIVRRIKEQLESEETLADKMIKELFGLSTSIDSDNDDIFVRAQRRALCHAPPGKSEDIGDRLAWESLLESLPEGSELH